MDLKAMFQGKSGGLKGDPRITWLLGGLGVVLLLVSLWAFWSDWNGSRVSQQAQREGQAAVDMVGGRVNELNRSLSDATVTQMAMEVLDGQLAEDDFIDVLTQLIPDVTGATLYPVSEIPALDPTEMGANGFAVLDMLLSVMGGQPPLLQLHRAAEPEALFVAFGMRDSEELVSILVVSLRPAYVLDAFNPEYDALDFVRLSQYNGRQATIHLKEFGDAGRLGEVPDRIPVAGSLFRVEFPQHGSVAMMGLTVKAAMLLVAILCLVAFLVLRKRDQAMLREQQAKQAAEQRAQVQIVRKDPKQLEADTPGEPVSPEAPAQPKARATSTPAPVEQADSDFSAEPPSGEPEKATEDEEASPTDPLDLPDPPPMTLNYDIARRRREREAEHQPVELLPEIFRAYDIRGVIDKTLDSGVARQVGQAVGSLALEAGATPVVVARDGRLSGPYLMEGMIEGITAAGCDVLDIGAVPTGVLYYAAHEKASGSGVMITGSHNPPDYNGFKVMIGGNPLHGEQVTDIYDRITQGRLNTGAGTVTQMDVVDDYIERIASDIQIERPLKVVIDCGNGIGGVCAAETLRAVGAEVLPLFDEVDGTFPNHHPDPSEPETLEDLITSVRVMDADLGLALDGDADRLGVVTLAGNIIYPDRVMMLLALDVLDRNPGATIIYDVKCTNHLPKVIEGAGGKAVMYKTGHSVIKAYMKEIGSPFAGEMSGHFFFEERWYGVDDGIYAACRLLEILGGTENPPEAILNALPTSFSTPELKVQMQEGENHAFIDEFRSRAQFTDATVHTIDGLRADFDDGWGLVRASNTTPILVVRFDAESEEALARIKAVFRSQMLDIRPDLELPF